MSDLAAPRYSPIGFRGVRTALAALMAVLTCLVSLLLWAAARGGGASCPLAPAGWDTASTGKAMPGQMGAIWIEARGDALYLDGTRRSRAELLRDLSAIGQLTPMPYLRVDVDAVDCARGGELVRRVAERYDCASGSCWLGGRRLFERTRVKEGGYPAPW